MGRPADVTFGRPDQYGQVHPIETKELIARKLQEFEKCVEAIQKKRCLLQAQQRCPELLTADFKLMFLRCDCFDAALAADRYVLYWTKRVSVFGEQAFQPLTCPLPSEMSKSDRIAVEIGVFNIYEANGRIMAFEVLRRYDLEGTSRQSFLRAYWYFIHLALRNQETQKRGIVVLNYPQGVNLLKQQDLKMAHMIASLRGAMPMRLSAYHIVDPPGWVSLFLPLLTVLIGKRLRKRVLFHTGTRKNIHESLSRCGLNLNNLPTELGGTRTINMADYLAESKQQSTELVGL